MVTSLDNMRLPTRRETDTAAQDRAILLDQRAGDIVRAEVPAEVVTQVMDLVASVGNPTTRGPLRRAFWLLSHGRLPRLWAGQIPKAACIYRQADDVYWGFSLRHERLLHRLATIHAFKSMISIDEVLSAVQEAPYRAAILWDPSRGAYTTALTWQVRALWQRAPERQSVVSLPTHRMIGADMKGFGKIQCLSLDTPRGERDDDGDLWVDSLVGPEPEETYSGADQDRVAQIVARLPERCQLMLRARSEGLTLRESGALLGVSRERARQLYEQGMAELRERLQVPAATLPAM